jgi:hypothetical protein
LPALILIPNLSSGVTIDISSPFHLTLFATPAGAGHARRTWDAQPSVTLPNMSPCRESGRAEVHQHIVVDDEHRTGHAGPRGFVAIRAVKMTAEIPNNTTVTASQCSRNG